MPKSIAKSCPLCLSVNDPVDMLGVTMPHSTPPQSAPLCLCRLCVLEIMKSAFQSDLIDPQEVLGDVKAGDLSDSGAGGADPGDAGVSALVPENQSGAGDPAVDRPELAPPAGRPAEPWKD